MKRIMNFQSFSLNEAQSFEPEDAKEKIKKDPRVSMILKKDAKFADLKDPKEFFATIKNLFLNNPQIIKYEKDTSSFTDWGWDFRDLRKVKPEDFNADKFETLHSNMQSFFKQIGKREKLMVSTGVKKAIEDWINTSGRHNHRLSKDEIAEIDSIPGLKPDKPIKLYRGLLWKKYHMNKDGDGRKFIQAMRKGTDVVDYVCDVPESWTLREAIANKFATAGPAGSEFSAMLNWLSRGEDKIEGELGAVIAILAKPEDVLADLSKVGNKLNTMYEWEDEVVLKPGKYVAKIVKLYNKKGEISPKTFLEELSKGGDKEITEAAQAFKKEFVPKVKKFFDRYYKEDGTRYWNADRELFQPKTVKRLMKFKDEILGLVDEYIGWLKKMKFDTKAPEFNAMSGDLETYIYKLYDSMYKIGGNSRGIGGKKLFQFKDAAEIMELLRKNNNQMRSLLGDYMKWGGIIKRDISNYRPETVQPQVDKVMRDVIDAAGVMAEMEFSDLEKEGYVIANEVHSLVSLVNILERVRDNDDNDL